MSTALRRTAPAPGTEGTRLLREPRQSYADGAEERVLEILRSSTDVSSTSGELLAQATNWAETYHLSPQRGVVLEFLDIPAGAKVLEIGAGCGPITRHLGERGAIVDAVEPMPARAAANRERCRDLADVEIFVGELEDVPDEEVYDIVVIVGVLEYMGGGATDRAPYLDFLRGLRSRLVDGGQLVLAIENQLGVKYLAGAAEDHTNRIFDGIEGYPHQLFDGQPLHGPARTFSDRVLRVLVEEAGFGIDRVLAAFPDYKMTRAVMDRSLDDLDPKLAARIPRFPSPDWLQPRPRIMSEASLWQSLIDGGLHWEFANSAIVCAVKGDHAGRIWPRDQLAGFAAFERRPGFQVRTALVKDLDGARYDRRYLGEHDRSDVRLLGGTARHVSGANLIEALAVADDTTIGGLLRRWLDLVDDLDISAGTAVDAVPHNIVIQDDGRFALIDDEFRFDRFDRSDVVLRGLLWTAEQLLERTPADRWTDCSTVADVVRRLWSLAGEPVALDLERLIAVDAVVAAAVAQGKDEDRTAADTRALLERSVLGWGPGLSTGPHLPDVATYADVARDRIAGLELGYAGLEHELMAARETFGNRMDARPVDQMVGELMADRAYLRLEGETAAARVVAAHTAQQEAEDREAAAVARVAEVQQELASLLGSRAHRAVSLYRRVVGDRIHRLLRRR